MLKAAAEGAAFARAMFHQEFRLRREAQEVIDALSGVRAVQEIARGLSHHRDRFIVIGDMSDRALAGLRHTVHPTVWGKPRSEEPTDLGFEVISARDLQVPFEPARICVTDVTYSDFVQIIDAIDAWNSSPECHTNPLAPGGTQCDCFVPHHAFEAAVVIADWDCDWIASKWADMGWIVIDLRDFDSITP